jgi:hypothetical protein
MLAFDPGFCLFSVLKVIFYFRSRTVVDFPVDRCVALSSLFDIFNCYGYFRGLFFFCLCVAPGRCGWVALTSFSCHVKSACDLRGGVCMPSERSTLSPQRKWRFTVVSFDWFPLVLVLSRRSLLVIFSMAWARLIVM